jgi:hypothetical protein
MPSSLNNHLMDPLVSPNPPTRQQKRQAARQQAAEWASINRDFERNERQMKRTMKRARMEHDRLKATVQLTPANVVIADGETQAMELASLGIPSIVLSQSDRR